MDYENQVEFCEYNPISLQYENELNDLRKVVEKPLKAFFQKMLKKIIVAEGSKI